MSDTGLSSEERRDEPSAPSDSDGGDASNASEEDTASSARAPGTAQKAAMVAGGVLTAIVLAYLVFQFATVAPTAPPRATVIGTEPLPDGRVAVTVALHVPEHTGLTTATVSSSCWSSQSASTTFSNLPADSTWTGTVICPAGTTNPTASVDSWVEA